LDAAAARSKRGKDARSTRAFSTGATEDAAARSSSRTRRRRTRLIELHVSAGCAFI